MFARFLLRFFLYFVLYFFSNFFIFPKVQGFFLAERKKPRKILLCIRKKNTRIYFINKSKLMLLFSFLEFERNNFILFFQSDFFLMYRDFSLIFSFLTHKIYKWFVWIILFACSWIIFLEVAVICVIFKEKKWLVTHLAIFFLLINFIYLIVSFCSAFFSKKTGNSNIFFKF